MVRNQEGCLICLDIGQPTFYAMRMIEAINLPSACAQLT